MAIQYKDYYEILGVPRDADDDEVRRAFRKLARLYHPDATGNDSGAEARFKEINEAYEVLGDRERRMRYDEFNTTYQSASADEAWARFMPRDDSDRASRRRERFTLNGARFSEFFEELFGDRRERPRTGSEPAANRGRGDDLEADIWVSLEEVFTGAVRQVTMRRAIRCETCFGMGQIRAERCSACQGAGTIPSTVACKVKVPQGVKEGALLRVPGRGEQGIPGAEPGDLYLKVCYSEHPNFQVEGANLVHDLELAPWEAVLGVSVSIPALDGPVSIRVPAGTQGGQRLRIRQKGLHGQTGRGDLFVRIKVQVPPGASPRERELWEELAKESQFQARPG